MNIRNALWLILFTIAGIFAGCKSGNKALPDDHNPAFSSDPVLKAITEQIGKDPKNAKLYMDRGDALRKMKLDSLAYKDYVHAVKLDSANASYYSKIGEYLFESKDLNGSIQWFQKALTLDPKDLKSRLKIGKALLYFQKYQEGLNELNLVLRADVYNPEAYFLKGMIYKESKDTAKAISSFQTALQVKPDYKDAIIQLGMIYSARKDSIALRYLENAWTVDSSDVFPLFARGVFYQDNKDYARAKEEYRRCVLRDRHYVDAYFNLGYILMQEDSVVKSYRQYDIVTQIDPRNPTAYFDRAVCLEAMDSIKAAIADYRHALILDPNYPSPKAALKRLKVPLPASQK